jgi:hypothetical protein
VALILDLFLVGTVLAQGTPSIDWCLMAGGGGSEPDIGVTIDGTLGHAVARIGSSPLGEFPKPTGVATRYSSCL